MKKIVSGLISGLLFVLMVLPATVKANVVAKVDDLEITDRDLAARMEQIPPQYKSALASEEGKKRLVEQLTQEKLIYLQAKKENYDTNADVLKQLETIKQSIMIRQFLADTLKAVKPMEEELKAYYQANTAEFEGKEEVWAKHILCKTEDAAKAARALIVKGESFEDVARDVSTGPSAENGGDLGWFTKDQMVPEFAQTAFSLEKEAVSEPVKTQFGYHIIKSYGKKVPEIKPFDAVRAELEQKLTEKKQRQYMDEMIGKLKEEHSVTIY